MNQPHTLLKSFSGECQTLIDRAKTLDKMNSAFSLLLPDASREHIVIMNIKSNSVILAADSALQLTYLRFEHQNLLTNLKQIPGLERVTQLQFKIQPTAFVPQKKPVRKAHMSAQTGQMIRHIAEGFEDQHLRSALVRLAKNSSSSS